MKWLTRGLPQPKQALGKRCFCDPEAGTRQSKQVPTGKDRQHFIKNRLMIVLMAMK